MREFETSNGHYTVKSDGHGKYTIYYNDEKKEARVDITYLTDTLYLLPDDDGREAAKRQLVMCFDQIIEDIEEDR